MERLQKYIAESGYTSRRKAEELIKDGKVKVNGVVVTELGTKVDSKDSVEINGELLSKEDKVYYMLNKPRGVVCTASDEKGRKTVVDLIDTNERIYPVGRLDYDTTGMILLTNDGEFANSITHPKNNIDKVYIAKVKGIVKAEHIIPLEKGVMVNGYKTAPAKVKLRRVDREKKTSMVEITIHEGRNHEVKKMFEYVGLEVMKLKRERIAFLNLNGLNSGEYRRLTPKELKELYNLTHKKQSK